MAKTSINKATAYYLKSTDDNLTDIKNYRLMRITDGMEKVGKEDLADFKHGIDEWDLNPKLMKVPSLLTKIISGMRKRVEYVNGRLRENDRYYTSTRHQPHETPPTEQVERMYHASIDAKRISKKGFSKKVPKAGGLGGGEAGQKISFTYDMHVAKEIVRTLKEAIMIAKGQVKASDILEWAKRDGSYDIVMKQVKSHYGDKLDLADLETIWLVYTTYLFFSKRYDPLYVFINVPKFMAQLKKKNPRDVGIVVADVDMTNAKESHQGVMREFRVYPEAIKKL
ncbi:unnamed protein product, partial [marine sediment metagenome]